MSDNKQPTLNPWLRPGIPARFQDATENMVSEINDLCNALHTQSRPVSPVYRPNSPVFEQLDELQLPAPQLVRCDALTEEKSMMLDLLKICRQIASTTYANNHALNDICRQLNVEKTIKKNS
jgi:hypothetical protein